MGRHPFFHVDAFSAQPLGGNPCAVVLDADGLDEATLQAIARDMNLSETAFVVASERADFGARYFTPREEIPMAGHPTIATAWVLLESGRAPWGGDRATLHLELPVGPIRVDAEREADGGVVLVMTQPAPEFGRRYEAAEVLPIFGLPPGDAHPTLPIEVVSTGTPQLMVPLRGRDALDRIAAVDGRALAALREAGGFFSVHCFCLGGATPAGDTYARHFFSPPEVIEDPFTGSGTGAMAALLWREGALPAPRFSAEQGHGMGRPGCAAVEVLGPPQAISGVRVGGRAATLVVGELRL